MSELKPHIESTRFVLSTLIPMDRLAVDTIGPLFEDIYGFVYILVIIDTFTRFIELYPQKDASAISAARSILNHSGRYGFAREVVTDNGKQYVAEVVDELFKVMGTNHVTTMTYASE